MANQYLVTTNTRTKPDPEDFKKVRIVVQVIWKTERDSETGEEKKFSRTPLEISLTRPDYREDENILFTLLNKVLPREKWARLEWTRGEVDRDSLVWPVRIQVNYEVEKNLQELSRCMLGLDDLGNPVGLVPKATRNTLRIYQHTDTVGC